MLRSIRRTSRPFCESNAPVGSSANTTSAPPTSARAMATRCCSPPDRSPGRSLSRPANPTLSNAARVCLALIGRPARRAGSDTLSPTESEGMRLYDWKTKPTCPLRIFASTLRRACTTCLPITSMEPSSAASSPERQYSSVDLPEPLGPTMLTISPTSTLRSTPFSTSVTRRLPLLPVANDFLILRATTVEPMRPPSNGAV